MNLNPLPIRAIVKQDVRLDGQDLEPGDEITIDWLHFKKLERSGILERTYEMDRNNEAVKDVLIFTPMLRLEPETVRALMSMDWDGALSILIQKDNPGKDPVRNHLHQYQRGREIFLAGPYDAMLIVESDIVPPADTLRKLADLQVDLAYGVYRFRASDVINVFERYPVPDAINVGESLSVKPWLLEEAVKKGKIPCSGAGFGCLLVRRRVIEAVPFREGRFCDTPFTDDVYRAGYSQMADMSVICGHKDENGEILWPKLP